jgi:hypothetical protein
MIDAKALLAAFEKPTYVTLAGETKVGRPLSHVQYRQVLRDLDDAGTDEAKTEAVLRRTLTDMELPADEILQLPDPLYWAAIKDFFRCCRGEQLPATEPAPSTPGPNSATSSTPA